jgi:hypothetical protein
MTSTKEATTSGVDLSSAKINQSSTHAGLTTILYLLAICFILKFAVPSAHAQALGADNNRRYDQNAYLEAHDAYTTPSAHYTCWITCNQDRSIDEQLDAGVRSLDLRIWKVRQFKYAANYQARIYNSDGDHKDTFAESWFINESYGDHDPQIVLGHHIYSTGLGYLEGGSALQFEGGALYPLENFSNRLKKIREWLEDHANEVVTLNVDNNVPKDNIALMRQAFTDAGLSTSQMFILGNDYVNVGLPPRQGRPGGLRPDPDGWWLPMDGMPTLQYLIDNHRRLVYYDDRTWSNTSFHKVMVDTIYGNHSVPKGCFGLHYDDWADAENGSKDINDFTIPLFMMQHVRDDPEPTHDATKCVQDIEWLKDRLIAIENKWHRLPNIVRVDHAAKTTEVSGASNSFDGPKAFVTYLNQRWADQPTITPLYGLSSSPDSFGWNNTAVTVYGMWGVSPGGASNGGIRQVIFSVFGAPDSGSATPSIKVNRTVASTPAETLISDEGKSVVSFYLISSEGSTSERGYVDIWIDKTLPTISGHVDRAPNAYGWYQADVTASFAYQDAAPASNPGVSFSGIDPNPLNTTPTVTLSTEGSNQTITGKATDKAGNANSASLTGINLDKTKPTITYTGNAGKYTPDQFINITCTPADSLSGVRVNTCQNISGEGYDFVDSSQKITPHAYSAEATDYADNVGNGSTSFTVEVTQQAVSNLTARFVTNAGVANSLQQKLRSATEAETRGDLIGKAHHVDVYVNELQNHIGRFISSKNAATLVRLARAF